MTSACSSLPNNFLKSILGSRIDDACDALFFIAFLTNCGVRIIIRKLVIFVFF